MEYLNIDNCNSFIDSINISSFRKTRDDENSDFDKKSLEVLAYLEKNLTFDEKKEILKKFKDKIKDISNIHYKTLTLTQKISSLVGHKTNEEMLLKNISDKISKILKEKNTILNYDLNYEKNEEDTTF